MPHRVRSGKEKVRKRRDFFVSRHTPGRTGIWYDVEVLFDSSFHFQNELMNFYHHMMPTLCPASMQDSGDGYLFKPKMLNPGKVTMENRHALFAIEDRNIKKSRGEEVADVPDIDYDFGVLQMQVPHRSAINEGKYYYKWENVYVGWSFLGEDFSGAMKPSINGASNYMDAMNAMALGGNMPTGNMLNKLYEWATYTRYGGMGQRGWEIMYDPDRSDNGD